MKPSKRVYVILGVLLLAAIAAVCVWQFWPRPPAFQPPERDKLAVSADGWDQTLPTLKTDVYDVTINPDLRVDAAGKCDIWFKNPTGNTAYLMLDIRLKDSGLLVYRTGLVAPGEGIPQITFVPEALASMKPGAQPVTLTMYSFALEDYMSMGEINLETTLVYEGEE